MIARPFIEYHEDMGDVLWWKFPIVEAPYVGSPLDQGKPIEVRIRAYGVDKSIYVYVGGWTGHHTHWTPLPEMPTLPETAS